MPRKRFPPNKNIWKSTIEETVFGMILRFEKMHNVKTECMLVNLKGFLFFYFFGIMRHFPEEKNPNIFFQK